MAKLILGPVLRYVGETEAVVWVETDEPCTVQVLDHEEPTFCVARHHFALVVVEGLEPGGEYEYEVALDGERRWPEEDSEFPPSVIRTLSGEGAVRFSFGSCRVSLPHHEPYVLPKDEHPDGREFDALCSLTQEMCRAPRERWPQMLLMLGDQVYADEVSPQALAFIKSRRDVSAPPGEEVADFEEYTALYREAWGDPTIRWLFSTVSCAMVVDDHDVHDDWNISAAWVEDMREKGWWAKRERAALASYWVYQFIGNLSPSVLRDHELYRQVREADDAEELLSSFATRERGKSDGARWSYCRDLNGSRLIVIDSRCGRVLEEGRRSILDENEWEWLEEQMRGDFDHLLIGTSDPFLLAPGLHYMERWGEAMCAGAWGEGMSQAGEWIRRTLDFDHWAAFGDSFERLAGMLAACGAGEYGRPPASITVLSGDVHHAYLAAVAFPRSAEVKSAVWQAVCSPYRNALKRSERSVIEFGNSRPGTAIGRLLARSAGVGPQPIQWKLVEGPAYDNQIATITLEGRTASMRLERTVGDPETDKHELHESFEQSLT